MGKRVVLSLASLVAVAAASWAVGPGTDLWIPSVGHGPGQFGSQWRTDVWVSRPQGSSAATVDIYFLPRGETNSWPAESRRVTVNPGETREFPDIVKELFAKDNAFGALRFVASDEVVVTARIYSAGLTVVDPSTGQQKTGSAGQFFAALPAEVAIAAGESTDIQGVGQDSAVRTNVGWVEVAGNSCVVQLQRIDGNGATVATQTYNVQPYAVVQKGNILNELGGSGGNQRLRVSVVSGTCRLLAFGSRLDNATNDPSTIEMRTPKAVNRASGVFMGAVLGAGNAPVGGLSFQVAGGGVTAVVGNGAIDCGGIPFTLDFGPTGENVPLSDGAFSVSMTHDYYDGQTKVLTVAWVVSGTVSNSGAASGLVSGTVTFKASGDWGTCSGLTQSWRAGWVQP